jgi:uncharacterized protein YjgD (DUF1641 family)
VAAMTNEEQILERLDRLEQQVTPIADSARSLGELRDEMAPRLNEAVHFMIAELAEVESDFQLEDLLFLTKKLMRNVNNLSFSLDQMKNIIDFALTAEPLMKSTVPQLILFLEGLEQKGVFRLFSLLLDITKKVSETYSTEELAQIGDGLVSLLGVLKKVTTPESIAFIEKAAEIPSRVDLSQAKKVGPFGMLGAMGNSEVKEGLGIVIELTKGLSVLKNGDTPAVQVSGAPTE